MLAAYAGFWITTVGLIALPAHAVYGKSRHPQVTIAIPGRPRPQQETYKGCPQGGRGGDVLSNLLRNRIDPARHPTALSFKQFLGLDVPPGVAARPMVQWSSAARKRVYKNEGTAVSLVGYIRDVSQGPREPANCMGKAGYDWHIRLGRTARVTVGQTIITEATPWVRAREDGFSVPTLNRYEKQGSRVRITGWLFLDNDHSTDLDRQRATLWEIHPVTGVDVWTGGHWKSVVS